jgi:hypothetical protein
MKLSKINTVDRLYVIEAGEGFSCYGFDVLDKKARAVAAWSKVIPPLGAIGTQGHFEQCSEILEHGAKYAAKTGARCDYELTPQLAGLEGKRVEVTDNAGGTRRFRVGKSTGWMPCHLELANSASSGGPAVYGAPFKAVRVIK